MTGSDAERFLERHHLRETGPHEERDDLSAANPGWRDLIPRLTAAGAIPATPEMIELLTAGG